MLSSAPQSLQSNILSLSETYRQLLHEMRRRVLKGNYPAALQVEHEARKVGDQILDIILNDPGVI